MPRKAEEEVRSRERWEGAGEEVGEEVGEGEGEGEEGEGEGERQGGVAVSFTSNDRTRPGPFEGRPTVVLEDDHRPSVCVGAALPAFAMRQEAADHAFGHQSAAEFGDVGLKLGGREEFAVNGRGTLIADASLLKLRLDRILVRTSDRSLSARLPAFGVGSALGKRVRTKRSR